MASNSAARSTHTTCRTPDLMVPPVTSVMGRRDKRFAFKPLPQGCIREPQKSSIGRS